MAEPEYIYDYDPRNLPDDLLKAIGLVTASFAQTDSIIETAIAGLLGVDVEVGWAATTHMAVPLRRDILKSVAEVRFHDPDLLNAVDSLDARIREAATLRNKYAHGQIRRGPGNVIEREVFSARGGLDIGTEPVDAATARADADTIRQVGLDLYQFLIDHDLMPDFPPDNRPRSHRSKAARKERRKTHRKGI